MYAIPIQPNIPAQVFTVVLNNIGYNMTAKWNTRAGFWTLDIADENGVVSIADIALKAGSDLLEPFNFNIGGLFVVDTTLTGQEATLSNIGIDTLIVYVEPV